MPDAQRTWGLGSPNSSMVRRSLAESNEWVKARQPWENIGVYREENKLIRVSQLVPKSADMDKLLSTAQTAMQMGQQAPPAALAAIKPDWDTLFHSK